MSNLIQRNKESAHEREDDKQKKKSLNKGKVKTMKKNNRTLSTRMSNAKERPNEKRKLLRKIA